jgi:hypothetical protein
VSTLTPEVLINMGIVFNYTSGLHYYRYMTANGDYTVTPLPRSELFDRIEGNWKIPKEIPAGWGSQNAPQEDEEPKGWWELNQPDYVQPLPVACTQAWRSKTSFPCLFVEMFQKSLK